MLPKLGRRFRPACPLLGLVAAIWIASPARAEPQPGPRLRISARVARCGPYSCRPAGRDPRQHDTARKHASKWRDAGYGYLVCGWPDAGRAQVEAFARDVMPEFSG